MTDSQLVVRLQDRLSQLADDDIFSGAVLLAKNDTVLFQNAYGCADHAFNARNTVETKFNLGSMGKMFTAVSILQLAQQDRLSLSERLIKYVPDYPDQEIAAKISLYQLLTHTSGLPDMFNEQFISTPKEKFDSVAAHLPLFTGKPLQFEPGSKWSYSNSGYIVLGLVIEHVSGETYNDYVREHVFAPAGMIHTDNYMPHDDVADLALGYTIGAMQNPQGLALMLPGGIPLATSHRITNHDFVQPGASAGGGYSTVTDLLRFARALQGDKLLDAHYTELDVTGKVPTGRGTAQYGFGMMVDSIDGVRIVGHGGSGPGISSNLDMYPDSGYVVAVMSNYDGGAPLVNERMRLWLTGQDAPQSIQLVASALEKFAGTYILVPHTGGGSGPSPDPRAETRSHHVDSSTPIITMQVTADSGGLWLISGSRHRLLPISPVAFFDDNAPTLRFTFEQDRNGRVKGFSFNGPGGAPVSLARQS